MSTVPSDDEIMSIMDELDGLVGFESPVVAAKATEVIAEISEASKKSSDDEFDLDAFDAVLKEETKPAAKAAVVHEHEPVKAATASPVTKSEETDPFADAFSFVSKPATEEVVATPAPSLEGNIEIPEGEDPFAVDETAVLYASTAKDTPMEAVYVEREEAKAASSDRPAIDPRKDITSGDLDFIIDAKEFANVVKLTEVGLSVAMMTQAGHKSYYGMMSAQAEQQHAKAKLQFEITEARLYEFHRSALVAKGEKATEKQVEAAVRMDAQYMIAKNRVIEAEGIANIAKSCVLALNDKRDMIIQIGADRREELKGSPKTITKPVSEDSMKDLGF